jgi:hypothetical protein
MSYSGYTTLYEHLWAKRKGEPPPLIPDNANQGVQKVWMLDAQWSTCPIEVEEQVKGLWRSYELGNDRYMLKMSINDLLEIHSDEYPTDRIVQYLKENGVSDEDRVIIHWWW